jgi:acyl-CoA synthetase (AMP-forming)/AMP-acid ligase II
MTNDGWPLKGDFETVSEAMDAAAEQFGDIDAYVDGDERLSFADWVVRADALAAALEARGVRPGDVVALLMASSIDYAVAYAAAVRMGAIATGINPRLGPREVASICARCSPRLVILDPRANGPEIPAGIPVFDRSDIALSASTGVSTAPRHRADPSDPVAIIWTSGTTGEPKGAWFDHRNLLALAGAAGVTSAPFDRKLMATPFAHAGYMAKLWDQLASASTLVLCPTPWSAKAMARLVREEHITATGGAPIQWEKMLDELEADDAGMPRLRVGVVATAPAPPTLIERVEKVLDCTLVVRYAMTESPSITGTEPEDEPLVKTRTVGRPQGDMTVVVVDGQGNALPRGELGEVWVKGGCVMRGYWAAPELTAKALSPEGWLRSSDTGYFDPAGNLVLVGRSNEMYIRGGYNIYPVEVENILLEHPDVDEVGIVGAPAPGIGEIGIAFVVVRDPVRAPSSDALRQWVRERLADYKAPDRVVLIDALPRTAMMKLDRTALQARVADLPVVAR